MSDVDVVMEVLRERGWTCEYHEPVSGLGECGACDVLHSDTAVAIVKALEGAGKPQVASDWALPGFKWPENEHLPD